MNVVRVAAVLAMVSVMWILATVDRDTWTRLPYWHARMMQSFALLGCVASAMVWLEIMLFGVKLIRMGLRGQRGP